MRKFTILLMCLFGIGLSYAEEVNIVLERENDDEYLERLPPYFFLDNTPRFKSYRYDDSSSPDVVLYDYNLTQTTIHFNCEKLEYTFIQDTRFDIEGAKYTVTQCFFNNDDLYESVTYDVGTVIIDLRHQEKEYNYRVINQNGEVLYAFEAPDGYKYSDEPDFYKVTDDIIIVMIDYWKFDVEGYSKCRCYYSLKVGQTGSIAAVKQMSEMKINSNPVSKGDDLVVTVGDDSRQSTITVTTLSGIAIKEIPIVNGRAVVNTSDLPCGLYIASQKGEGTSAKFIVK